MKIFLDSANLDDVRTAHDLGAISGVTTNPSIISRENRKFDEIIADIVEIMKDAPDTKIFAEVLSVDAAGMIEEGKKLAKINKKIVVKVPAIPEGFKACKALSAAGINVCVTVIFAPTQAILAANAGAKYVAPFVGRLDDIGEDGLDLVANVREILDAYNGDIPEIVAASVRHPVHVIELAKMGCDIATMPLKVILQMAKNPNTERAVEGFLKDWEKVPK